MNVKNVSIASLVVPGIAETITLSSFNTQFNNEDLPTFGFPTIPILGIFEELEPLSFAIDVTISSNKWEVLIPWIEEIAKGLPKPNS